jgi:Mg/Co/Ni transporter MgtE
MTFGEILAQVISEITGKPKGKIIEIVNSIEKAFPGRQKLEEEVPDDKVEELLDALRREKPAILAQLMEYDMLQDHHDEGNA